MARFKVPFGVLVAIAIVGTGAVAGGPAGAATPGCAPGVELAERLTPEQARGLNVKDCDVADAVVVSGEVSVEMPQLGTGVSAEAVTESGHQYLEVSVSTDGYIDVLTEPESETAYAVLQPDGETTPITESQQAELLADSYDRCDDWSYANGRYYAPSIIYLNSVERRPSNISKADFEQVTVEALKAWKTGSNHCGIVRALDVPGSISYGNWTHDTRINDDGTCGVRDDVDVVEFGPLPGGTLGLTCTWYDANDRALDKDIRMDNSYRSWVTSASGCSGTSYDLRSVLTYEMGHMIALNHVAERGVGDLVMSTNISTCDTSARYLGAGDVTSVYLQHRG